MKRLLIAAFVAGFAFASANAQTTTPEAAPPPAAGAPAAGAPAAASPATGSPNAKPTGKQARAQCQAQAKAQGLTGPQRKQAVQDCFASARPDLAQAQKCRQQAKANGVQGTQLTAFMQAVQDGRAVGRTVKRAGDRRSPKRLDAKSKTQRVGGVGFGGASVEPILLSISMYCCSSAEASNFGAEPHA